MTPAVVSITHLELETWTNELRALSALGALSVTSNGVLVLEDGIRTRDDLFARLASVYLGDEWRKDQSLSAGARHARATHALSVMQHGDTLTERWARALRGIAYVNVFGLLLLWYRGRLARSALAVVYVTQCTVRCFVPCDYQTRRVLHDHPLNSVVLQRALAFAGEVCFGYQVAGAFSVPWIVSLDVTAQLFATYGTLTGDPRWFYAEAWCWTAMFVVFAAYTHNGASSVPSTCGGWAAVYMIAWYLPECALRAATHHPRQHRPEPVWTRRVTREWSAWRSDAMWMTPYFSLGAWASLYLAHTDGRV